MRVISITHVAFCAALLLHGLVLMVGIRPERLTLETPPQRISVRLKTIEAPAARPAPSPPSPVPQEVRKVKQTPPPPKPRPESRKPEKPVQRLEKPVQQIAAPAIEAVAVSPPFPSEAPPVVAEETQSLPDQARPEPPAVVGASRLPDYLDTVRRLVEMNKSYPSAARQLGQQGSVLVRVRILPDGQLAEAEVIISSGHRHLDRAALAAVRRASPLKAPSGFGLEAVVLEVPITFRLI
ncbi:MAG: energy transducer TonB [Trichloromonadaceae bacterium]